MTIFAPDQQATARAIRAACTSLGHADYDTVLACLVCNMDEQSGRWLPGGDGHQGSMYGYQQGNGYGSALDRASILTGTRMYLEGRAAGNGGDQKLGYLQTDPTRPMAWRIQDVQMSAEGSGTWTDPKTGQVVPFAQNYVNATPDAVALLALIGGTIIVTPRYPGAYWRPSGNNDPNSNSFTGYMDRIDGLGLHEAVTTSIIPSSGTSGIWGWVSSSDACTLYDDCYGSCEQYKEFGVIAYGMSGGNHRMITYESWDGLHPSNELNDAGQGSNETVWTSEQIERKADVLAFLHATAGVPIRMMRSSNPNERGLAPHRWGVDPWRAQLDPNGEVWTQHAGKTCPGDLRIGQMPGIVARAQVIADAVAAGSCGYLPTGPVDLTAALARTGTTPPDTGELTMDAEAKAAIGALDDKVDTVIKLLSGATGDGQASFASTMKALLHLIQGDQNLDAQDLAIDKVTLAQQQANFNTLNRIEKQTAAKPIVTVTPAPGANA